MFILPLITSLAPALLNIIGKFAPDPMVRMMVQKELLDTIQTQIMAQRDIIMTETNSESWLVRMWRPLTAISFSAMAIFILFVDSILKPTVWFFWGIELPQMVVSPELWNVVIVCLGGYMGLRSIERIVKYLKF